MADTLRIEWIGADGSVWDLLDPRQPVMATSIAGLGMPGFVHQWSKSGARDGSRHEGTTWNNNSVSLTVRVGDTVGKMRTGADWRALDRDWRRAFSTDVEGKLVVTSEVGRRELRLLLDDGFPVPDAMNPALRGYAYYVIALTAGDEPWWTGDPVAAAFEWSSDQGPFFNSDDSEDFIGLYIADEASSDAASMSNPGDREGWPQWWIRGLTESAIVGVGTDRVTIPFRVADGQTIYVDSFNQTITDSTGTNLWPLMGFADPVFAPLPAGAEAELVTQLIGAQPGATVGVTLVPRYNGPW